MSVESAKNNLENEIPHWNFSKTRNEAEASWDKELSKIEIEADEESKHIFYTALYHSCIAPNIFSDVDGSYRGTDLKHITILILIIIRFFHFGIPIVLPIHYLR